MKKVKYFFSLLKIITHVVYYCKVEMQKIFAMRKLYVTQIFFVKKNLFNELFIFFIRTKIHECICPHGVREEMNDAVEISDCDKSEKADYQGNNEAYLL